MFKSAKASTKCGRCYFDGGYFSFNHPILSMIFNCCDYPTLANRTGAKPITQSLAKRMGEKSSMQLLANRTGEKNIMQSLANRTGEKPIMQSLAKRMGEKSSMQSLAKRMGEKSSRTYHAVISKSYGRKIISCSH
ncbi:hypothetical protein CDAR_508171 [Caerostris darwini]|uniref:Uncharacterized protein n=1 Tax=Caerostris darwini TaxID=1538125 RepID=A0AAV4WUD7_9ARAC|nr:hypothetical protein CDAR_508171 [Caerostris darwini]